MPFEIQTQHFGDLTEYVVLDSVTGNRFVIIPELGGVVRQLSLRKTNTLFSILKTPGTPELLKNDTQSASELLFPFASRIPAGKYEFLGKKYQLEQNDPFHPSAIHGMVRKQRFHLGEQAVHDDNAYIKLHYRLENVIGYPFSIDFSIQYTLDSDGVFSLTYESENMGADAAPIMFGWHPYFQLGTETADAWKIDIPSDEIVTFDENLIPTGKAPFSVTGPMPLFKQELDNCFVLKSDLSTAKTLLISDNQKVTLQIEQETGPGKFNHLVVYTPGERDCIAIEALTANVNAFNNGEGLNTLAPGQLLSGTIKVRLL